MEYFENTSTASAQLRWSSFHQAPQVIPATQLFPDTGLLQQKLTLSLSSRTNIVLNWAETFTLQSATNVTGPWSAVANPAIGPYSVSTVGTPKMFFRLVDPISP